MKKELSIEYAHIYTNNRISDEQIVSLDVLKDVTKNRAKEAYSLMVMIDDYSFPDPTFDYKAFLDWLSQKGFKPDVVTRESQLIPACDETLHLIENEQLKHQITDYIKSKKYPCSLFIATWYLLRLGHTTHHVFDAALSSQKIINILPLSFKPFEDKALEIIKCTKYKDAVHAIENKYFEGRLIA